MPPAYRLYDQTLGCLLGGLCGDAIGRPGENLHYRSIEEHFGRITGPMAEPGKRRGRAPTTRRSSICSVKRSCGRRGK